MEVFYIINESPLKGELRIYSGGTVVHRSLKEMLYYNIITRDGKIEKINNFYFSGNPWVVRYIAVNKGGMLNKRLVLVSIAFVQEVNKKKKEISLDLTLNQIINSPDVVEEEEISCQKEMEVSHYYALGYYWIGNNPWGKVLLPEDLKNAGIPDLEPDSNKKAHTNLQSIREVLKYHVQVEDGEIGYVKDMVINFRTWTIDFFILNSQNILPGKTILASSGWLKKINREERKIHFALYKKIFQRKSDNIIFFTNN